MARLTISPPSLLATCTTILLTVGVARSDVVAEDPPYDARMCRYVNDTLDRPPAPGYLDVLSVAAEVVGPELRVHITTRETVPPQAPGVYVFQCIFSDPDGTHAGRLLAAVLGQSEPKYGCSPPLAAVGAALVQPTLPEYPKLAGAGLSIQGNQLTISTSSVGSLHPEYLEYVTVRYYDPQAGAYGECVDEVGIQLPSGACSVRALGPLFVGAAPAIEGLLRSEPSPATPPQKRPWFDPWDPCPGGGHGWRCPPREHQIPLLPSPPNGDRDIDDDGTDDWYYGPSLTGGGSELRGWNDPVGNDDSFVAVIPKPGGGYKYLGGCRWPGGVNDWWIDENGLAHWQTWDPSTGRMWHWVYSPYTGKLRLWCGYRYGSNPAWIGHDWANPPESLDSYWQDWRCVFSER